MSEKTRYRLPNGKETISQNRYISEWRKFCKPICKVTGLSIIGFNPGVLLGDGKKSIDLPSWFVEKINEAINKKTKG